MDSAQTRAEQITGSVPAPRRAAWVARVLRCAIEDLDVPEDVTRLTDPDLDFVEAAAIFHRLRPLTLQLGRGEPDRLREAVLLAAENAAKVVADPSGERFDPWSVGWFWLCIEELLDARSTDRLTTAILPMLNDVVSAPGDFPGH